jgi:hypothetical protein
MKVMQSTWRRCSSPEPRDSSPTPWLRVTAATQRDRRNREHLGFEDDEFADGERRASTNWPIQKYQWTDYMANPGDTLQYRVLPMVGTDKTNLRPDPNTASEWTEEVKLTHQVTPRIEAYFNRGIVAAQWVSRRLGITKQDSKAKKLRTIIDTPDDPFRNYLTGPLGARLFELLTEAAKKYGVCTQMGNQGSSEDGLRTAVEVVQSGAIGAVKEVRCGSANKHQQH